MENKYKDLLETFLKEQKVYYRYMAYLEKHRGSASFEELLEKNQPYNYIQGAFLFKKTDEGLEFWKNIHENWVKVLEEFSKHNYRIVINMKGSESGLFETREMFYKFLEPRSTSYEITIEEF